MILMMQDNIISYLIKLIQIIPLNNIKVNNKGKNYYIINNKRFNMLNCDII